MSPARGGNCPQIHRHLPKLLGLAAALAPASGLAAVPASEVTLQAVITDNLPLFTTLSGYELHEDASTTWANQEIPLYTPYHFDQQGTWENVVAEVLQSRMPVIMCATRGAWTLSPADLSGPGNMNPRKLRMLVDAIRSANATNVLKIACFVDSPAMRGIYQQVLGLPNTANFDFANTTGWDEVVWQRTVKPWFDTVPSSFWYRVNGRPVIQWWGFHPSWASNHAGNARLMFTYIANTFEATYGERPWFILPRDIETSSNQDPGIVNHADVLGFDPWFGTPNEPARYHTHKGFTAGTIVPSFIDPGFYNPASSNYQNYNRVIFRNKPDGSGNNGDTLRDAMAAGVTAKSRFTVLEGWTNVAESAGFYRSNHPNWDNPNQYIDIVRSFSDLRTVTLRLEAEGADDYYDTTTGNSGGAFLRAGENLDVRALAGLRVVTASSENPPWEYATHGADGNLSSKWYTPTPAPGWLQIDSGENRQSVVTSYHLTSSDFVQQRDPKDWVLQGSNNGTSWVNLDSRSSEAFTARKQTRTFTFSNSTAYRYHRLNVTATYGGGSNGIALGELTLHSPNGAAGGGWVVTNTAAGEWIQFNQFTFSPGNYKFAIRYSTTTAGRQVRLHVDGVAQPAVTLPVTSGMNVFDTINVGQRTFTTGKHNLRLEFVNGGVDVDWLFAKKVDRMLSLRANNNSFVCAESGGDNIVVANRASIGAWEKFSANDHNGGVLSHNDEISLQSWNGLLLCAEFGGGGNLFANRRALGGWERFTIVKTSGSGAIANGDTIALRTANGNYLTVGAANRLDATATTIGAAQTFTVTLNDQ